MKNFLVYLTALPIILFIRSINEYEAHIARESLKKYE